MTPHADPSMDPADDGSFAGTLRIAFEKLMQGVDGMLPARVIAYDRESNTATVQPQIMVLATNGRTTARAQVAQVPVLALGGGGFVLNFPLKPGDTGWIEASDRDISLYTQAMREAGPNTTRLHSFSDGRFIPDVMRAFNVASEDDDSVVLQSTDGAVCLALSPTRVRIRAPQEIQLDAPIITMRAGAIAMQGEDGSTATVTARGNFNFEGAEFTHNGKNVGSTHRHSGVQTGSGNSGGPV